MPMKKLTRREMLKLIGAGTAGLAGSSLLAACAPEPVEPEVLKETVVVKETVEVEKQVEVEVEKVVTAVPEERQKVVFEVWANDNIWPMWLTMMLEFTQAHPEVEIETNRTVGGTGPYRQKLLTQLAAGDASDVMHTQTALFGDFAIRDAFLPLDDFIAADDVDLDQYFPATIEFGKFSGQQQAMPLQAVCSAVYYNKSHFDGAGLDYPSAGWTWDEMLEMAIAMTKGEGADSVYGFHYSFWGGNWYMPAFVWSNGGEFWSEDGTKCLADSEEFIEATQFYFDLRNEHAVSPTEAAVGADPSLGSSSGTFAAGRSAMVYSGTWSGTGMLDIEDFDWDIVVPPVPESGAKLVPAANMEGPAVSRTTKVPEGAWKWVKFVTGAEGQRISAEAGFWIPAIPEVAAAHTDYMDKNWQAFLDVLAYSRKEPAPTISGLNERGAEAWEALTQELGGAYGQAKSVEDACVDGAAAANKVLQSA